MDPIHLQCIPFQNMKNDMNKDIVQSYFGGCQRDIPFVKSKLFAKSLVRQHQNFLFVIGPDVCLEMNHLDDHV